MHLISIFIIVIWIIFWVYWLISAFNSKKNVHGNFDKFVGIRLVIFVGIIIIVRYINISSISYNDPVIGNIIVKILGLILFLAGLALAVWARLILGKNWGMPMTQKQEPELVTSGPYEYIRHPIYSGILLAIIGSVLASSIYWLVLLAITSPYFIYSALNEERLMLKQFPKVYPAYKKKTKMLIPFVF